MQKLPKVAVPTLAVAVLVACATFTNIGAPSKHPGHYGSCGSLYRQVTERAKDSTSGRFSPTLEAWPTWDVPEFQDLQRLIDQSVNPTYGPLVCVVAQARLDTIDTTAFANPNGVTVALVVVRHDNHGLNSSYTGLRLNANNALYCVMVRNAGMVNPNQGAPILRSVMLSANGISSSGSEAAWVAYVVPPTNGNCVLGHGAEPIGGLRMRISNISPSSIPPVARFIGDSSWASGIGFRCADAWCAVGISQLLRPAHGFGDPGVASASRSLVPGWYDDQHIATPGYDAGLPITATTHASVVPFEAIDGYTVSDFSTWRNVAVVRFQDAPSGKYLSKWQFKPGAGSTDTIQLKKTKKWFWLFGTKWKVRINGQDAPHLRVTRTPHKIPNFHIVATARWAWSDVDEPIWVGCSEGCCLIEPTGIY